MAADGPSVEGDSVEIGFRLIDAYFRAMDDERKARGQPPFADTEHGIWGGSDLSLCLDLFKRIDLDTKKGLLDLGSGDGRVALLASLFTRSLGIEGDASLHDSAKRARTALSTEIAGFARCDLRCGDYLALTPDELSSFDAIFIFADHSWPEDFERRLLSSWEGVIYSYADIFSPRIIRKGATIWVGQKPVVTYPVNLPSPLNAPSPDDAS